MIIDCISDLHGFYPELEGGDLLIVAGDLTGRDSAIEHHVATQWICTQNYKKKIFIAGNHDNYWVQRSLFWQDEFNTEYLCDSGTEFEGLKIWGSPWSQAFEAMNPLCKAFTYDKEEEVESKFSLIPADVDILITHSPPFAIFDMTKNDRHVGSTHLLANLLSRIRPKLHVFGHIHEGYGQKKGLDGVEGIFFVNASHVNERYQPVNKPIRVML